MHQVVQPKSQISQAAAQLLRNSMVVPKPDPLIDERYEVLGEIAKGGLAKVLVATDMTSNEIVCLKMMRDEWRLSQDPSGVALSFKIEAEALSLIRHPGVVSLIAFNDDYSVLEFVNGHSLEKLSFPTEKTVELIIELCHALSAVHAAGIIHRDIKPENVLVADDRTPSVVLIDFGSARLLREGFRDPYTDWPVGTPAFASPEAVHSGDLADERSDVFSLGAMLYEKLVGTPPFFLENSSDPMAAFHSRSIMGPAHPIRSAAPWMKKSLASVVDKALEPEPENRYQSVEHFRAALENVSA